MRRSILTIFASLSLLITSAQEPFDSWQAGSIVSKQAVLDYGIERCFAVENISDAVFARMKGKSYKEQCVIPRQELRYIKVLHIDIDGNIKLGELVVNKSISSDIITIFRKLYHAQYPIEKIVLVDNYNADDDASMRDNNSSAFNYRYIPAGGRLSAHSRGMAIDINPLYNPYIKQYSDHTLIAPKEGSAYTNRQKSFPYKLTKDDLCCQLFIQHGFEWGGDYKTIKDYQHFEKR